jgi:hypothetical protein
MDIKNFKKIMVLMIGLIVVFLLVGCWGNNSDKIKINEISKNIEESLKKKDVDLFMENISSNYSDSNGGTYDNHIHNLPENLFAQIELVENLLDPILGLKVMTEVSISDLIITEPYTSGKMKITISLKWCLIFCTTFPGSEDQKIEYDVDFQKEGEDWKIISLIEI